MVWRFKMISIINMFIPFTKHESLKNVPRFEPLLGQNLVHVELIHQAIQPINVFAC